jgi:hypothetical protein
MQVLQEYGGEFNAVLTLVRHLALHQRIAVPRSQSLDGLTIGVGKSQRRLERLSVTV